MKTYNVFCDELRVNGGILEQPGSTIYFKPDYMSHREDGPAYEYPDGVKSWYYNDIWIMDTKGNVTKEQVLDFRLRIL